VAFHDLFLIFIISLSFPGTIAVGAIASSIGKSVYLSEQERREKWYRYDDYLIPHIIKYIRGNPERITYTFGDDRAEIIGLINYLSYHAPLVPYSDEAILDPWGNPIWIIMDHDSDMKLHFNGKFRYGVYHKYGNELVVGLYTPKVYSLKTSSHEQFQMKGGQIKNSNKSVQSTAENGGH